MTSSICSPTLAVRCRSAPEHRSSTITSTTASATIRSRPISSLSARRTPTCAASCVRSRRLQSNTTLRQKTSILSVRTAAFTAAARCTAAKWTNPPVTYSRASCCGAITPACSTIRQGWTSRGTRQSKKRCHRLPSCRVCPAAGSLSNPPSEAVMDKPAGKCYNARCPDSISLRRNAAYALWRDQKL